MLAHPQLNSIWLALASSVPILLASKYLDALKYARTFSRRYKAITLWVKLVPSNGLLLESATLLLPLKQDAQCLVPSITLVVAQVALLLID